VDFGYWMFGVEVDNIVGGRKGGKLNVVVI
jgi:hypothetical protein